MTASFVIRPHQPGPVFSDCYPTQILQAVCFLNTVISRICQGNDESLSSAPRNILGETIADQPTNLPRRDRRTLLTLRHTADIPTSVKVCSEDRMGARGRPGQPLLCALYKPSSGHGSFLPWTTIFPLPLIQHVTRCLQYHLETKERM